MANILLVLLVLSIHLDCKLRIQILPAKLRLSVVLDQTLLHALKCYQQCNFFLHQQIDFMPHIHTYEKWDGCLSCCADECYELCFCVRLDRIF